MGMAIFKRFKTGDSLHKAVNREDFDKIFNILEDTEGEGCEIQRENDSGLGWKIVVPEVIGDTQEDVSAASGSSITKRHDEELNCEVLSLKGFAGEAASDPETLDGITLIARNAQDGASPDLIYLTPEKAVPVDSSGESTKTIARNANGELQLYGFDSPGDGTIDADCQDDYYVLCRQSGGNELLQRKIDFGTGEGYSGDIDIVSEVKYSTYTHKLEYSKKTLTFENGILTGVTDADADTLIDQAVEETV